MILGKIVWNAPSIAPRMILIPLFEKCIKITLLRDCVEVIRCIFQIAYLERDGWEN